MIVTHGWWVLAEGFVIAYGGLGAMFLALKLTASPPFFWFIALLAAAFGAWSISKWIANGARVRAWLLVSSQCWSAVPTLGCAWAMFQLVR